MQTVLLVTVLSQDLYVLLLVGCTRSYPRRLAVIIH